MRLRPEAARSGWRCSKGRGIWHAARRRPRTRPARSLPLDWTAPFPAQWRVDWRQADRLTGSWEMIAELAERRVREARLVRQSRHAARRPQALDHRAGPFQYPCWIDQTGRGYLPAAGQAGPLPGAGRDLSHQPRPGDAAGRSSPWWTWCGPRWASAPASTSSTSRGRARRMKGRATCATRDALKAIYAAKQQKQKRAEIEKVLDRRGGLRQAHPRPDRAVRRLRPRDAGLPRAAEEGPSRAGRVPGRDGVLDPGDRRGVGQAESRASRRRSTWST